MSEATSGLESNKQQVILLATNTNRKRIYSEKKKKECGVKKGIGRIT
jgi:hypothetical protein